MTRQYVRKEPYKSKRLTPSNLRIIEAYKRNKSTLKFTADQFGITRERVRQVINKYLGIVGEDEEIAKIYNRFDHSGQYCSECHRSFKVIKYSSNGLCAACASYIKDGKVSSRRKHLLPPNCVQCGRRFETGRKGKWYAQRKPKDICGKCYSQSDYFKSAQKKSAQKMMQKPEVRERLKAYQKEYQRLHPEIGRAYREKNREKFAKKAREYYHKNKEAARERNRRYYRNKRLKNPEAYNAREKERYQKRKAERESTMTPTDKFLQQVRDKVKEQSKK